MEETTETVQGTAYYKAIYVPIGLHQRLKVRAAQEERTLKELAVDVVDDYLKAPAVELVL